MKTLVIGDLHGALDIATKALAQTETERVVFVGDYVDSFDRTVDDQIETLLVVLTACEDNPDRVTALFGNHEMSYLDPHGRCSGWSSATEYHMIHLAPRMKKAFKYHTTVGKFLVTHAGVSARLLSATDIELDEYLDMGEYSQVGWARGGSNPCGGLLWCDFNTEFEPIPEVPQIFGHTHYSQQHTFKTNNGSYNIDCLPYGNADSFKYEPALGLIVDDELNEVSVRDIRRMTNETIRPSNRPER